MRQWPDPEQALGATSGSPLLFSLHACLSALPRGGRDHPHRGGAQRVPGLPDDAASAVMEKWADGTSGRSSLSDPGVLHFNSMIRRFPRRWMATLLSVALIVAPLTVGAAKSQNAPAPDRTAAAHAHHDAAGSRGSAHDAATNDLTGVCEQHQSCLGQCCAACAHCVAAVPTLPAVAHGAGPDHIPFLSRLDGRLASAPPGPPPRG